MDTPSTMKRREDLLFDAVQTACDDRVSRYRPALYAMENGEGLGGKRVLEIGCGAGLFLVECRRRGAIVSGIEPGPQLREIARSDLGLDVRGEEIPGLFDWIVSFDGIDGAADPAAFLRACRDRLSPGGRIWLETRKLTARSLGDSARASALVPITVDDTGAAPRGESLRRGLRGVRPLHAAWRVFRRLGPVARLKNHLFTLVSRMTVPRPTALVAVLRRG